MKSSRKSYKIYVQVIFLLFCITIVNAQKTLSRSYSASGIENILIDGNGVHLLKVRAAKVKAISVRVRLEGETSEEIGIKEQLKGDRLQLGFGSWPFAKMYNDKLSAHKVVSVEVVITIPENMFVSLTSNTTAVVAQGKFRFLYVDIEDEDCLLKNFLGGASLKTNRGRITIKTQQPQVTVKAASTYGTVINSVKTGGKYRITAKSVHGDITLQQTQ